MKLKEFKKLDIKTKKLVDTIFLWNYKSSFKWRWLEFSEFRSYEYWDDAKYIDWLVSAREGKTVIRRYEEERELNILFMLDLWTSMNFWISKKKIDLLKEIFFLIWVSAVESSDRVWAILLWWEKKKIIKFKKWKVALFNILKEIDNYKSVPKKWKKIWLKFLNNSKIKKSLVFVLTDKTEIKEKQLWVSREKNDMIFINIFDSFENTLALGNSNITLWNDKNELNIDLADTKKKKEYVRLRKEKIESFRHTLQKKWIDYIYIDEKTNIYKELVKLMKMRGVK